MDNTARQIEYTASNNLPEAFKQRMGKGRPKGSKNKSSLALERLVIPQAIQILESIPQSIRDKYKEAMSWKGLTTMETCLDTVETTEKPEDKFNMAARLYDLTTPRVQNIQVDSRQTVIRSQDLLEGLKLLKRQGNDTIEGQE